MNNKIENENSLNRREMLSSAAIASLTLTAGLIGISTLAIAQTNPGDGVPPKFYTPPNRTPIRPVTYSKSAIKTEDLDKLRTKLKDMLVRNLQLSSDNSIDRIDNQKFQRIESFISVNEALIKKITDNFLYTHVEILLDQAANLLDRGIKDRAEWDEKAIKNLNLALELKEFFDLDDIHKEETDAGYYNQQVEALENQLSIETLNKTNLETISKYFDEMFKYRWTAEMQKVISETYAAISSMSSWRKENDQSAAIGEKTRYVVEHNQAIQFVNTFIQENGYLSALDASKRRSENLQQRLDWEKKNRDFRIRRTSVTRKYQYIKTLSSQADDGILNYNKRLVPLAERFKKDFDDAFARLIVSAEGLKKLYGYDEPLPKVDGGIDFFDRCVIWNRDAINWINRFSRLDQSYVFPISLKSRLDKKIYNYYDVQEDIDSKTPEGSWDDSRKKGEFTFTLDETLFQNQRHIRIRGLSVFASLLPLRKKRQYVDMTNGTIIADINLPGTSSYRHLNGDVAPSDQSKFPTLRVGRISTRDFARTPEICGTSIFYNASPLGTWKLSLPQVKQGNLNEFVYIDDIFIDLFVTMRAIK